MHYLTSELTVNMCVSKETYISQYFATRDAELGFILGSSSSTILPQILITLPIIVTSNILLKEFVKLSLIICNKEYILYDLISVPISKLHYTRLLCSDRRGLLLLLLLSSVADYRQEFSRE